MDSIFPSRTAQYDDNGNLLNSNSNAMHLYAVKTIETGTTVTGKYAMLYDNDTTTGLDIQKANATIWIVFDLAAVKKIVNVEFDWFFLFSNSGGSIIAKLQYSTDNSNWTDLYSSGTITDNTGRNVSNSFGNFSARYIRLINTYNSGAGNTRLQLWETRIWI